MNPQAEEAARVQQQHQDHVDFLRHQIERKQAQAAVQQFQLQQVQSLPSTVLKRVGRYRNESVKRVRYKRTTRRWRDGILHLALRSAHTNHDVHIKSA